ncbi:biopolymer transporter ExbB [Cytophagales bacterium WSM2-2]|nr:biopolymer transporter ExbB [Cytophagales bacterium WSM2-2]
MQTMILQIAAPPQDELTFIELMMKGGIVMIPILLLSLAAIYVAVERYLYLRSAITRDNNFVSKITRSLSTGNIAEAKRYAQDDDSATGNIISAGIDSIGRPMREIESLMESATNIEVAMMERNTGYLGIIAGVAPMLGFIGTITGIIHIFYNISIQDNINIGVISGGLYEKMITSGTGLGVGIIAYVAYHLLQLRIGRFTLQIQKDVFDFLRSLQVPAK